MIKNNLTKKINSIVGRIKKNKLDLSTYRFQDKEGTKIPNELWDLKEIQNLKELSIYGYEISTITNRICKLTNLEVLSLSSDELLSIPEEISNLQNLKKISINSDNLEIISEGLTKLKFLNYLSISVGYNKSGKLKSLHKNIGELRNLERLYLSGSSLEILPESIGDCLNLKHLDISKSHLTKLTDSICTLKKLKYLNLSNNKIDTLPKNFGNLESLKELYIDNNLLTTLPQSIGNCKFLQLLTISNNKIVSIPKEICFMVNLKQFILTNNDLEEIPDSIGLLTDLLELDLSSNKLKRLPESLNNLCNLQKLKLSYNELKKLPDNLEGLSNLNSLMITDNRIDSLPMSFVKLKSLVSFAKSKNSFDEMPQVKSLKGLYEISQFLTEYYQVEDTTFSIPNLEKEWLIPIQQYLMFFREYIEKTEGREIDYQVKIIPNGLEIKISDADNLTSQEIGVKIMEYVNLLRTNLDEWIVTDNTGKLTPFEADILKEEIKENMEAFWYKMRLQITKLQGENRKIGMQLSEQRTENIALKYELVCNEVKLKSLKLQVEDRNNTIQLIENQLSIKDSQIGGLIKNGGNTFNFHGNNSFGQLNISDKISKIEFSPTIGISREEFDIVKHQIEQLSLEKQEELKSLVIDSETPTTEVEKQSLATRIYNWFNKNGEEITKEITAATYFEALKYLFTS
jgi:Leucine-rich repeat (LRR) protein